MRTSINFSIKKGFAPILIILGIVILLAITGTGIYISNKVLEKSPTKINTNNEKINRTINIPSQSPSPVSSPPQSAPFSKTETDPNTIKIIGSQSCQVDTKKALDLIKEKAPEEYIFVNKYIGAIECKSQGSGMYASENPPRFQVGDATRQTSTLWYASAIIHDSCHSKQYQDRKNDKTPRNQEELKRQSEEECLTFQAQAIKKMGGSQELVNYVKNQINTNYWNTENRSW